MAVGPLEPRLSRRKAAEGVVDPLGTVDPLRSGDEREHHPGRARAQRHRVYGVLAGVPPYRKVVLNVRVRVRGQMRKNAHVAEQAGPIVDSVAGPQRVDVDDSRDPRRIVGDEDVRLVEVTVDGRLWRASRLARGPNWREAHGSRAPRPRNGRVPPAMRFRRRARNAWNGPPKRADG